jgi:hypothetical protein
VQSVLRKPYWDELCAGLGDEGIEVFHVVLDADEATLRARITGDRMDPAAERFRLDHIGVYAEERTWLIDAADLVVDATQLTPDEVVAQVLAAVPGSTAPPAPDTARAGADAGTPIAGRSSAP